MIVLGVNANYIIKNKTTKISCFIILRLGLPYNKIALYWNILQNLQKLKFKMFVTSN